MIPRITNTEAILCYTDGAWSAETKIAGAGWVFVDSDGAHISNGQSAEPFVSSPLMAEALAIRSAVSQALELGFLHLQIKSDAHDLIRALTAQEKIKEIYGILFDIKSLASFFTSISFMFIPRSENVEADSLAKYAARELSSILLAPL